MDTKDTATLCKILDGRKLTVREFAKALGVHPETIRRWEKKGQIKCVRHPINNYRLFTLEDLEAENGETKI